MRLGRLIATIGQDIRYAARQLYHHPAFTISAVLTIALGVGANTATFSVADAILLRPLPYPHSTRLVLVWNQLLKIGVKQMALSAEDFESFRSDTQTFEATAAFQQRDRTLILPASAERISVIASTPGMLAMLGGVSRIGRSLVADDWRPDQSPVAVISYSLFVRRFSGSRAVIGQHLRLDDQVYTIVGVLPKGFDFTIGGEPADAWTPLAPIAERRKAQLAMLGLLNSGITIPSARQSIGTLANGLVQASHPYSGPHGEDPGFTATVVSLHDHMLGRFQTGATILMCTVALVLLIACVNVSNLLIARAVTREKEIAIRRSLGASPMRLLRQWMTESGLLAIMGTAAGVLAAQVGIRLLQALIPNDFSATTGFAIDGRVLLFTCAISAGICFAFGMVPLVAINDLGTSLRGPARRKGISSLLVSAEVALALMLSIGSGLLLTTLGHLARIDPGFRADRLMTMRITLSGSRYSQLASRIHFFAQLLDRMRHVPGVTAASIVDRLPVFTVGVDTRSGNPFSVDGQPFDPTSPIRQIAHTQTADGNYFQLMGIPLLAGRTFTPMDTADAPPVAIINQELARNVFPKGDALGKHILLGLPGPGARWMTIVGIIGNVRTGALDLPPMPQYYTPVSQDAPSRMFIIVRAETDPLLVIPSALSIVRQLDPEQPVERSETMANHVRDTMGQPRLQASLLTFFALTALFLAAIGIYGVVAHTILQRTKELAIRMALGAGQSNIFQAVLIGELPPVFLGIALGLLGANALTRYLTSTLYEVQPHDPLIAVSSAILLLCVGAVASIFPARRAARIAPMVALRHE
jgi:putative ABC transport system permease protein